MKPSSHQPPFIAPGRGSCDPTQQAADLCLSLNLAGCSINVFIEPTEKRHIVVTGATSSATAKPGSTQPVIPDSHTDLFSVELLLSHQALVAMFRVLARHSTTEATTLAGQVESSQTQMAVPNQPSHEANKVQHSVDVEAPNYPDRCQGTHAGLCVGELWSCAGCGNRICGAERTGTESNRCYRCWDRQYTLAMMPDAQVEAALTEPSLLLACACRESGDDCGTWLELTPEGILALEDRDGLRVSFLLPLWLEEAIRHAIALQPSVGTV